MSVPLRLSHSQVKAGTPKRLLTAVIEVLAEQGFADATVNEITSGVGHTVGAVSLRFPEKKDRFLTLFDLTRPSGHAAAALTTPRKSPCDGKDEEALFTVFGKQPSGVTDPHLEDHAV
jgi:AcrR family transcriptional regulator